MKKKLNISAITNELSGGSAFFPGYKKGEGGVPPAEAEPAAAASLREPEETVRSDTTRTPERPITRTPVRPNGKRIITRNSFEIYENQMDALRKRSINEKMEGRLGSMSSMVRDAIDAYLRKEASE